jgi:hypothetical protein
MGDKLQATPMKTRTVFLALAAVPRAARLRRCGACRRDLDRAAIDSQRRYAGGTRRDDRTIRHRFRPTLASGETLAVTPSIVIDGIPTQVTFAGLVGPGLYQLNVVVPSSLALGQDVLVVGLSGDFETQPGAFLSIAAQ